MGFCCFRRWHGRPFLEGGIGELASPSPALPCPPTCGSAIRAAVTELLDEMIRTSELLTEPTADPLDPDTGRPRHERPSAHSIHSAGGRRSPHEPSHDHPSDETIHAHTGPDFQVVE
jgi:hypothetical protein